MYVCICKAIKDSEIKDAVENGHSSLEALAEKLGVALAAAVAENTLRC